MKRLLLFVVAAAALFSCSRTEDGYRINLNINGDTTQLRYDTLVLTSINTYDVITDTAVVTDGKAVFENAKLDTPQSVKIEARGEHPQRLVKFFLERGTSVININFFGNGKSEISIKGGTYQTISDSLEAVQKKMLKVCGVDSLVKAGIGRAQLLEIYESVSKEVDKLSRQYIEENPASLYALDKLWKSLENISLAEAEEKLAVFKVLPEYAANKMVAKVDEVVNILKALQPGEVTPDFTINDDKGNPIRFSDFYSKNKVTMLDFWSSKCAPCRAFNPTLSKIYKEYKDKGFGILAVSLDKEAEAWLKAIEKDNVEWRQVSELKGWDSEVAKIYHVRAIPQSVFVDQQGRVIKRQPTHDEIMEILERNL